MPIAIIVTDDAVPGIIERETEAELFDAVRKLSIAPKDLSDEKLVKWVSSLAPPSGWYDTRAEAMAASKQTTTTH